MHKKIILFLFCTTLIYKPCHGVLGWSEKEQREAAAKEAREQRITAAVTIAVLVTAGIASYLANKAAKKRRSELRATLAKMTPEEREAYAIVMKMDLEKEKLSLEREKLGA